MENLSGRDIVKKFTRTIIATACLMTSFGALAHSYKGDYKGEAMPLMPVTIPVLAGGFDFTLGGLYLKPTSSNTEYVSTTTSATVDGVTTTTNDSESVNPKYTWGFLLGLGYVFPGTANDVRINWQHLHDNGDSDDSSFVGPIDLVIPMGDDGFELGDDQTATAEGEVVYDFDAVDLTFGQYINIGPRLQTRLFTGLRWARLTNELSGNYTFNTPGEGGTGFTSYSADSDSTFNGIGPIFGIEANYGVGYNIGIAGYFDAALLVGKVNLDQNTHEASYDQGGDLDGITNTSFDYDSQSVVAPAWDARLGINYTYMMNNGSAFRFEIGYQVSKYIDVIDTANFDITQPSETINFGLNGLYLQGTLKV